MAEIEPADIAGDADATAPAGVTGAKPISPQPHIESGGQREDAARRGDDEYDSNTNIIAGDHVPRDTPEADRARVARQQAD